MLTPLRRAQAFGVRSLEEIGGFRTSDHGPVVAADAADRALDAGAGLEDLRDGCGHVEPVKRDEDEVALHG